KRLDEALLGKARDLLEAQKTAFSRPAGDVAALVDSISARRLLIQHFAVMGLGDWLTASPEGIAFGAKVRALKRGDEVAKAVSADPARYLSADTRDAAVAILFQPSTDLAEAIRRDIPRSMSGGPSATAQKGAGSPLIGTHGLIEDTLGRLEQFFDQQLG